MGSLQNEKLVAQKPSPHSAMTVKQKRGGEKKGCFNVMKKTRKKNGLVLKA